MNRNDKIKALEGRLNALTPRKPTSLTDQLISEELENLRVDVSNRVSTRGLEKVQQDMASLSEKMDLKPMFDVLDKAQSTNKDAISKVQKDFERQFTLFAAKQNQDSISNKSALNLSRSEIQGQITQIRASFEAELAPLLSRDSLLASEIDRVSQEVSRLSLFLTSANDDAKQDSETLNKALTDLEKRVMSRVSNLTNHGDHANRNIAVGGNTSVLSRYTDINFKAGSNVTLTAVVNNTTKYTDITIASSGGSGGGSFLTPTGSVNGVTSTFGVASQPTMVVADGMGRVEGFGYSYSSVAAQITVDIPPQDFIRYM